ncbi:MAG: phage terminase large subunit [Methylobacter sp.]|uniref:phage terminase large subunit n=1 Tax=Methylobacter sp. TaxID=2051955 RepID=UPI00273151B0|nr:phage terminase large subunit [Methylobacter sp.]MDP1664123.1 phage terminase large subunit [Methylobacter sp.]
MVKRVRKEFLGEVSDIAEAVLAEAESGETNTALTYGEWCRQASPEYRWDWPHLAYIRSRLEPITDTLEQSLLGVVSDHKPRHLIFSVPPRHGKSEQVTVRYPAYLMERWPKLRTIVGAYNAALALKFSRKTKRIAAQRIALAKDANTNAEWETAEGGGLRAVGAGGGVTGHGANLIIIDDPVKSREEANSETYREKIWDWFTDDIFTRLEPGGVMIIIMTRWHEDDLVGRIQKSDFADDFEIINLAAEAEYGDPLGRPVGAALCPDRFNETALAKLRTILGRSYYSLYQGRPAAVEGDIINITWFKRYRYKPRFTRIVQSWDTAQKAALKNDYNVCITWGETEEGDDYLLDVYREKLEYPKLKRAAIEQKKRWNPSAILIEDKGHGTALGQELKELPGYNVIMIEPEGDKVTRMSVESSAIESGRVWLPEEHTEPWSAEFENECTNFPAVKHDDQVDSMSQYLFWKRNPGKKKADYKAWSLPWL